MPVLVKYWQDYSLVFTGVADKLLPYFMICVALATVICSLSSIFMHRVSEQFILK